MSGAMTTREYIEARIKDNDLARPFLDCYDSEAKLRTEVERLRDLVIARDKSLTDALNQRDTAELQNDARREEMDILVRERDDLLRLNDEYIRFCEELVKSIETDLTYWRRRAQFSLDAMIKRKCEHPEIMHNTKTDEHRCANERCNEVVVGRKCGLCDLAI